MTGIGLKPAYSFLFEISQQIQSLGAFHLKWAMAGRRISDGKNLCVNLVHLCDEYMLNIPRRCLDSWLISDWLIFFCNKWANFHVNKSILKKNIKIFFLLSQKYYDRISLLYIFYRVTYFHNELGITRLIYWTTPPPFPLGSIMRSNRPPGGTVIARMQRVPWH